MDNKETDFSRIVREHKSTIYTVCYMFSKDKQEVDDLFQEVLVKLWQGYDSFQGKSDLRTWIYRVSLNTCISIDRKKKRRKTQPRSWRASTCSTRTTPTTARPTCCMSASAGCNPSTAPSCCSGSRT